MATFVPSCPYLIPTNNCPTRSGISDTFNSFHSVSDKELDFVYDDMRKIITEYNLKSCPDSPMNKFIMKHFPKVWLK